MIFHAKFTTMITPRNLAEFSLLVLTLFNVVVDSLNRRELHIDTLIIFLQLVMIFFFFFFAFNESFFAKNHLLTSFISLLTTSVFIFL